MQTDAMGGVALANNFTVARVYRDQPNSSQVGALFVNRQVTSELAGADDYNRTYAVDGRWGIGQNGQAWRASPKTSACGDRRSGVSMASWMAGRGGRSSSVAYPSGRARG